MNITEAKQRVRDEIDKRRDLLIGVSHDIHDHPELCFEEHHAHDLLTQVIEDEGITVDRGAYGLETAFDARVGTAGPTIAVCCEYDALPEIGHACGHNIIAAAGLGAGISTALIADQVGGRLALLGTPAEEGGGGKEFMIRAGAFDNIDAAMMIHPAGRELRSMKSIAIHTLDVKYHGLAAHAAAAPEKGRNALDAAVLGYMGVSALRQHIRSDERIHGIFTDGGAKPNIVPDTAAAHWYVRSPTVASLQPLKERVLQALQAGAMAAGCTMEYEWIDPPYDDLIDNDPLLEAYAANAAAIGRHPEPLDADNMVVGSTDMGNVSHAVPSIHPMIKVAPDDCAIHTAAFAEYARSEAADQAVIDGAKAMAMTVIDCWMAGQVMASISSAHPVHGPAS